VVGAERGSVSGDGTLHDAGVEPGDRGGGEVVGMVEDSPFEQEVVAGGVQSGAPPGAVDQGDSVVGVQKGRCEVLDGVDVEAAGAEGGDPLDDLCRVEPGPVGTQTFFGVDQALDGGVTFHGGLQLGDNPVAHLRFSVVPGLEL